MGCAEFPELFKNRIDLGLTLLQTPQNQSGSYLSPEKEYPLSSRKAGRSKKIKPKKNLLDFLRDGSEEKE